MSVRLLMRAWLRRASSFRRLSLCCSIILFSSSIVFRLHSIDDICFRGRRHAQPGKVSGLVKWSELEKHFSSQSDGGEECRVDIYLRLELHHVGFDFHVGFIQLLDFVIQMLRVFFVVDT